MSTAGERPPGFAGAAEVRGERDAVAQPERAASGQADAAAPGHSAAAASRQPEGAAAAPRDGAGKLSAAFAGRAGAAALMPYIMGGFPSVEQSLAIGRACIEVGAEVIELGLPYSDPLADGPVIHEAAAQALRRGARLGAVLEVARELAASVPIVLMAYANMVFAPGVERFLERLCAAGVSGLIVPDVPLEESAQLREACDAAAIALVPLVAPTTTDERLARIGAGARGFLYAVSVVGTTGERQALPERFAELLQRAKGATQLPVALGFGIAGAEQARQAAAAGADGVIVGTRLVRAAAESPEAPADAVAAVLAEIGSALKR